MKPLKHYIERLRHEHTAADRRNEVAALKRGMRPNIYALGLILDACERLEHAVFNAANLDTVGDKDAARMLVHQIERHFTNTSPTRKVVKQIAKDYSLTCDVWAGYRDCETFIAGVYQS